MEYFLNIDNGLITIERNGDLVETVGNEIEYNKFFAGETEKYGNDLRIMASSSLNFPHEYTDNADVISTCQRLF